MIIKFEVGGWVWVYDDHSTMSGGRKHVPKTRETDSRSRKFALTGGRTRKAIPHTYVKELVGY